MAKSGIWLMKDTFDSNGETESAYYICANTECKDIKIEINPIGKEGDVMLDFMLYCKNEIHLTTTPFEFENTEGNIIKGIRFGVNMMDNETGEMYGCSVRLVHSSDKSLFEMLVD